MTNPQRFLRRLLLSLWLVSCFIGCDLRNAVVLFTWINAVLSGLHAISGLVASTASEFLVGVCGCHSVVGSPEKNFPSPASSVIFSCLWFLGRPELLVLSRRLDASLKFTIFFAICIRRCNYSVEIRMVFVIVVVAIVVIVEPTSRKY